MPARCENKTPLSRLHRLLLVIALPNENLFTSEAIFASFTECITVPKQIAYKLLASLVAS